MKSPKHRRARARSVRCRTRGSFYARRFTPTASPLPIWDILIPILLGLIIVDVATRRIAWDWLATKRMAASAAERARVHDDRKVESKQTLDALRRVREEVRRAEAASRQARRLPAPDPNEI